MNWLIIIFSLFLFGCTPKEKPIIKGISFVNVEPAIVKYHPAITERYYLVIEENDSESVFTVDTDNVCWGDIERAKEIIHKMVLENPELAARGLTALHLLDHCEEK